MLYPVKLCLTMCYNGGETQLRLSSLLLLWLYIEKYPLADYSHICILLTIKHFQVAIVKHGLGTPLSIQWSVTVEQAYGFQPYPCSLVTDMHIYKLQGLCYTHRGPPQSPSSPRLHLMTSSLICKIYFFFSIIRRALASDMSGIGLTCLGRQWIMKRVLGVLVIQSSMIIPFTQAGCRLSWLD